MVQAAGTFTPRSARGKSTRGNALPKLAFVSRSPAVPHMAQAEHEGLHGRIGENPGNFTPTVGRSFRRMWIILTVGPGAGAVKRTARASQVNEFQLLLRQCLKLQ